MGGAGKALDGGGQVRASRSVQQTAAGGGYGAIPHPLRVVAGQRYTPLRGSPRRRPFVVTLVRPDGTIRATREDGGKEKVELLARRLLSLAAEGVDGTYYRFVAYTPGRRYRTYVHVFAVDDDDATVVLPEWHPRRPVRLEPRLLPAGAGWGTWMLCTADLGVVSGGALNLSKFSVVEDPGPAVCRRPAVTEADHERWRARCA